MAKTWVHLALIFFFFFFFFFFFCGEIGSSNSLDVGRILEEDASISRETFSLDSDVTWVVQISDLHISSYHPQRSEDLKRLLVPALRIIRPSLLLITGDLTDAKNKERTTTRQDELEWIQYKKAMDVVIRESGMAKKAFFDIRGNHDKYGVPHVGHKLDFFSNYSISSQLNRLSTIHSISLVGKEWKYVFLGIDDSLNIGLRGPTNLFGHPSDKRIESVESELEYWDSHPYALVTKVAFGHFPMSFIASSEKGRRYESAFARYSVSTYLCGHLHAKFSKHLWRLHSVDLASHSKESKQPKKTGQFWEWELGDWKDSKMIRILAIDRGHVSFLDVKLFTKHEPKEEFQTTILITHPIDSRSMSIMNSEKHISRNDISALVFSARPVLNVTAEVLDSLRSFELVEELTLHTASSSSHGPLFCTKWNASNYMDASATRFWMQVRVVDIYGKLTASSPRPFSVQGKRASLRKTWLEYLIFHIRWETLYSVLLWSSISFLIIFLCLPKLLNHFMERNALYQKWAMSVSISLPIGQKRNFFWPLWFLIEGSRDTKLWCCMVFYLLYLLRFPWFWGHATSEDSTVSRMYLRGWTVEFPDPKIQKDGLGEPDIISVTLPFMYFIVSPLFLMVYCLHVERSAFYFHSSRKKRCQEPTSSKMDSVQRLQAVDVDPSKPIVGVKRSPCKICNGWVRTALLLACLLIVYVHFRVKLHLLCILRALIHTSSF
eukprot:TRINITY_DN2516_c2_g1_i1.p1 TRINITY_DN2516_c2_g1~~TRINITY_DN2516_c2_g1_i1.p1  ORF type:complete len:719 (+),score=94.54 TRINITY_DN2516_c2_g1_i1:137-2293(+)